MNKKILKSGAILLCLGCCLTSCKKNNFDGNVVEPSNFVYKTEDKTMYSVTFPSNLQGCQILGGKSVVAGEDYAFIVKVNEEYDTSLLQVRVNDELVSSANDTYIVKNVNENLNISISNLEKKSYISFTTNSYSYLLGTISDSDRLPAKYLEGVRGVFRGEDCAVKVDLSNINFDAAGTYVVKYTLDKHIEISESLTLVIYNLPDSDLTASVDLSNYKSLIIPESYGSLFIDYNVYDSNNNKLSENDIKYDSNLKFAYLSGDYISTLALNQTLNYKLKYSNREFNLDIKITDDNAPTVSFSMPSGEYGYYVGTVVLPTITKDAYSKQNIVYKYYLNGVETNKEDINIETIGNYSIEIKVFKNGIEYSDLKHVYTYHVAAPVTYIGFGWTGSKYCSVGISNRGLPTAIVNFGGPETGFSQVERDAFFYINYSYIESNIKPNQDSVRIVLRTLSLETGEGYSPNIITRKFGSTDFNTLDRKSIDVGTTFSVMVKARTAQETAQDYSNSIILRDVVGEFEIVDVSFINHSDYQPYVDVLDLSNVEIDEYLFSNVSNFRTGIKCGIIDDLDYLNKKVIISDKSSGSANDCDGIRFKYSLLNAMRSKGYTSFSFNLKILQTYESKTAYGSKEIDINNLCYIGIGAGTIGYKQFSFEKKDVDGEVSTNLGTISLSSFSTAGSELVVKVRTPGGLGGYDFQAQYELSNLTFKK